MRKSLRRILYALVMQSALAISAEAGRSTVDADGTVHVPAFAVPLSPYMSEPAKRQFIKNTRRLPSQEPTASDSNCPEKQSVDDEYRPIVDRAKEVYPVTVLEQYFAGVRTDIIAPKDGVAPKNRSRVLLNLHGGSFRCATAGGLIGLAESIPIAAVGKFKIIAIDYRTAPNYHYPAATEDVVAVYKALLKHYKPDHIGIFGCSTGASLTASVVAWLQTEGLPRPGAIGLFCEGANKDDQIQGDAWYMAAALMGREVPVPGEAIPGSLYMSGTSPADPLVAPVVSMKVLTKFPPTLLISGTRDHLLSEVLYTHARLVKAGVEADLHVWDGMWHGFFSDVDLPESKEMFDVVTKFFDGHLGKSAAEGTQP